MKRLLLAAFIFINFFLYSCGKKDAANDPGNSYPSQLKFLSYKLESPNATANIFSGGIINISFDSTVTNASDIVADFTVPSGCTVTCNNIKQQSAVTKNNYNSPFVYTITDAHGTSSNWTVISTNNNYAYTWGLGNFISNKHDLSRTYDWYIDQMNTGFDAGDNCGPSCVTMACKWSDSTFTKTAADARAAYVPNGGWWYTTDIDSYLNDNHITHSIIPLASTANETAQIIKKQIDANQLIILCIDMNYIRYTSNNDYHVDKFYSTNPNFGHFFIIKGYMIVDNELYFRVYDPNNWGLYNNDGTLKGKDRFYRSEDVFAAANPWWQYAFNIAKKGNMLTGRYSHVIIKNIPAQYGR